ncbi:substrate-binding domain-containing protein [Agromyces endophyticus]|uniref:sugar ABC transporter substrate-binding protein n=1 Tax=Agromyces sp. H17E-10 TaxID=2932244 RepID=UPI001FD15E21|nr:substrate-binding domain-containing protein [Agromyces sp. H17E-10]UOQ89128.1 substrate-binding domain-containing protein [Agromyces sp. H17E-10]
MQTNTRRAAVLLGLAGVLALTACTGSTEPVGSSNDTSDTSKGALAMSFAGLDIPIWVDQLAIMEPIINEAGYEFLSDDPAWDIQTQVNDWENWIQRGDVKAIMGYPVQSDSMVAVSEKAQAAGIPVLGYASTWDGISYGVLLNNYEDGVRLGEEAGEWIKENADGSGAQPVALLGYWDTDLGRERSEGIADGLKNSGANVDVNEISVINLDDGYAAAQTQLAAEPDTKIWLGMASEPLQGAYQYLTDQGVAEDDPTYLLGALDATDEILDIVSIDDSIWRLSYILPAKQLAEANAELLISAAEGDAADDIVIESTKVTADNAADFYVDRQ